MKKFIVFFMLCVFLFSASLFKSEFDFSNYNNLEVQVFTSNKQDICFDNVSVIDNGQGQIIYCDYDKYKDISSTIKNISGVTFIFEGNKNLYLEVIEKLNVTLLENNYDNFVGYSNKFTGSVSYNGKKINVQGYYNKGKIYIGTPLLLGSY